MIDKEPAGNVVVLNVARPDVSWADPNTVCPSLNETVPVGVPADALLTPAVNVTDWPTVDGLSEELSVLVVAAGVVSVKWWKSSRVIIGPVM